LKHLVPLEEADPAMQAMLDSAIRQAARNGRRSLTERVRRALHPKRDSKSPGQLLLETRLPLAEIAATLHHSDATAFTRAFRNWANATPSD